MTLLSVAREAHRPGSATVTVQVESRTATQKRVDDRVWEPSGMRDLRILLDGELVREVSLSPADGVESSAECQVDQGQAIDKGTLLIKCAHIALPTAGTTGSANSPSPGFLGRSQRQLEFTAYAYSVYGIKSESSVYRLPEILQDGRKGKAYLIVFGANASSDPKLNLAYAAKDADSFAGEFSRELLKTNRFSDVVTVKLVSDYRVNGRQLQVTERNARKGYLENTLAILAGRHSSNLPHRLRCGTVMPFSCPAALEKAGPNDAVILYVAAHGDTDPTGRFFILPYDVKSDGDGNAAWQSEISSQELAAWFRDVDAGSISIILDTCYSKEAIAEPGFKPGPFGSKDLGELAYAKGIRVLAASQGFAFETGEGQVNHGLLNAALIEDGLIARKALYSGDTELTLSQLFQYALKRVPETYKALYPDSPVDFEQHPTYFDFGSRSNDLVFRFPPK